MATSIWSIRPDIEQQLVDLIAANPGASNTALASALTVSNPDVPAFTADQVQKRRHVLATRGQTTSAVDLADIVERTRSSAVAPEGYAPKTIAITEVESDPDSNSTRRVSVTYAVGKNATAPVTTAPIRYFDGAPVTRESGERVAIVLSDGQYPYCSMATHEAALGLLADVKPDVLVFNGDMIDLPTLSTHRSKPELEIAGGLNAELAFGYARLHEMRQATGEDTSIFLVEGNHELRAKTALVDNLRTLYGVRPAGDPNEKPLLSMERLLGLDHLGIKYVPGYPHASVMLADDLMVLHGEKSRTGAGNTVRAYLDQFPTTSVIVSHVHRAALISRAIQTPSGLAATQWGAETGTLSSLSGHEMGYIVAPNWTPAGIAVSLRPDGSWSMELITGTVLPTGHIELAWRGKRWISKSVDSAPATAPIVTAANAWRK